MSGQEEAPYSESHMDNVFIGISGLIGAGKSTLATELGKVLNLPVYYEPVINNEYLEDFYKDMSRYSFSMQVYLLNRRFRQQQQIVWGGKGAVQDRTIYEDSVFAKMLRDAGHMEERDYRTYRSLFEAMSSFMRRPNIIVHLDVKPEESMERVKMRNRGCESSVSLEYLQALYTAYDEFLQDIARVIPVIKVNWSQFRSAEEMAERIRDEYKRIANIRYIAFDGVPLTPRSPGTDPKAEAKGSGCADPDSSESARKPAKKSSAFSGDGDGVDPALSTSTPRTKLVDVVDNHD